VDLICGCGAVEKKTAMIALECKAEFGGRTRPNEFDRATLCHESHGQTVQFHLSK
jgi:hypothetical protein